MTAPPDAQHYDYSPTVRCQCEVCGKWFTPLKVWVDELLVHSAGIRTCSFECSRKLYNFPVMPSKWAYKLPAIKTGDDG